jgi:hypothetical protein
MQYSNFVQFSRYYYKTKASLNLYSAMSLCSPLQLNRISMILIDTPYIASAYRPHLVDQVAILQESVLSLTIQLTTSQTIL